MSATRKPLRHPALVSGCRDKTYIEKGRNAKKLIKLYHAGGSQSSATSGARNPAMSRHPAATYAEGPADFSNLPLTIFIESCSAPTWGFNPRP